MWKVVTALAIFLPWAAVTGQEWTKPPAVLPASATRALADSLGGAQKYASHVWRDTPPINSDGTVNAYVEIAQGDRRKWEFDMSANARAIDRMIPADVGGYPVNYGFVPQTVSYDGDPFDALVLGPAIPGGQLVRGVAVGLMMMEDEKGLDSKVVLSPLDGSGRARYELTELHLLEIGEYFRQYKRHEPGAFSTVPGWGSAHDGLAFVRMTHAFFRTCPARAGSTCTVPR